MYGACEAMTRLSAKDVLQRYMNENLPEFVGLDLIDVNQKGKFGNTPLDTAAVRGSLEEVQALLEGGADPNIPCEKGATPLHDAVGQGHIEVVRLLLKSGASPDIRSEFGGTPMEWATRRGLKEIAALFESK